MNSEKQITTIFKKAKKVKPRSTWLIQSKVDILNEIEKQEQSCNIFNFIATQFYKHRVIFLTLFIFFFLGATTVMAIYYLNKIGPQSDTFIGTSAKWLADEWKEIEKTLNTKY